MSLKNACSLISSASLGPTPNLDSWSLVKSKERSDIEFALKCSGNVKVESINKLKINIFTYYFSK